jgi:hypothetical protein
MSFTRPATAIEEVVTVAPLKGEVMETAGGVTSRMTDTTPDPMPPLLSLAVAVIKLTPSRRETPLAVKLVPDTVAGIPFTVTVRFGSLAVPATVTVLVAKIALGVGEVTATETTALMVTLAVAVELAVPLPAVTVAVYEPTAA